MHLSCLWRITTAAIFGIALSGLPTYAQERIGSASAISNQVEGVVAGGAAPLSVGSQVYLNEMVRTGSDGVAKLIFLDDTNLHVGPRSEVTLDRFVYNPSRSAGNVVIRASQGVFRFVTGSQRPQNYHIQTPIATIGVRGTVFDLYVQADRIVVTLVSGQILVTTQQGRVVSITRPGNSVTIYATGNFVRRADWNGISAPDFAALFGPVQIAEKPAAPALHFVARRQPPPVMPQMPTDTFRAGKMSFGVTLGGGIITSLPTESTSGFYSGNLGSSAWGLLTGVEGLVDVAQFGSSAAAFDTYVLSVGLTADYVSRASLPWDGRCGGVACTGTGSLNELNVLATAKLTTPISPENSVYAYVGGGLAALWPSGQPTGAGGPAFLGSALAPAVRVGLGFDHRITGSWSVGIKTGVQFTGPTEYDTTLPGERFRLNGKTEGVFGMTLTYSSP